MINVSNDAAKISDSLSGVTPDEKNLLVLGSLFSIIEPIENLENQVDTPKEFVINLGESKIIDYISNVIPDLHNKKIDISDFKKIEYAVEKDTSLNPLERNQILDFAKIGLNVGKNKTLTISINSNFNSSKFDEHNLSKKLKINPIDVLNNKTETVKNNNKNENATNNNKIEAVIKNNVKDSSIVENNTNLVKKVNQGDYSDNNLKSKDIKNNSEFVKKVKKNNHPNKIYNLNTINKNNLHNINKEIFKIDVANSNQGLTQVTPNMVNNLMLNKIIDNKNINNTNTNTNTNPYQISTIHDNNNQYSQSNNSDLSSNSYNSVLENLLDHLDLTEQGWTSKLAARIEKAFINGGEEIEFNLKPKNLGVLKISLTLKEGLGKVQIIAENSFVTNTLQQNEGFLQKLFNDQGMNLDFMAHNGNENFGSTHNFNQNEQNSKENNKDKSKLIDEETKNKNLLDENDSSRHIVNVIA
ncbi:MAG: flagellar hook-length control protein FliK [Proteobacteria bacterium]|nr:flagellar hook-length control protein FliK [Pseudomonadota bacterium]